MDYSHIYKDVAGKRIRVWYPWELKKPLYKRWIYRGAKCAIYYAVYKGECEGQTMSEKPVYAVCLQDATHFQKSIYSVSDSRARAEESAADIRKLKFYEKTDVFIYEARLVKELRKSEE